MKNPQYEQTYREVLSKVSNEMSDARATDFEDSEAKSLFLDAKTEYNRAISFESREKWINATTCLETASDFLKQAVSMEVEYQTTKWRQEASDLIDTANNKIIETTEWQSTEAESLYQQAQTEFLAAQNYFNQETLQSYQNAYDSASQAISYAEQAYSKEQTYLKEKEEQLELYIGLGTLGLFAALIAITILVLWKRRRN
jgi:hypothetical protein